MPFGIGPGELILILVVALIIFGPRRLPELGSSLGKAIREFRSATGELTRELHDELQAPRVTVSTTPIAPVKTDPQIEIAPPSQNCATCGTANPVTNKFCGGCGHGLDQA